MKKSRLISLISLGVASVSCVSIATAVAFATEKPTVAELFSYAGVTATNEKTDGATANKGLLLTATQSGSSAKMLAEQTGVFEANLKALSKDGLITLDNYSIKITDNDSGESFKIGMLNKKDYVNAYVEVANGNRGGYYYTNESYNIHPNGVSAGMNTMSQQYTMFYRNTKVSEETAGFEDSVKVKFNPETMEVSMQRGIYDYASPEYALIWDLDERINDGHDIGYSYSQFGDYSVEIIFDSLFGSADLLVYSMAGVDFSAKDIEENPVTIRADVHLNAVRYKDYQIPEANSYDLFGKTNEKINVSVVNEGTALTPAANGAVKPSKNGEMEITYTLESDESVSKTYTVNVVGSASAIPVNACEVADVVGVNSVIRVPATTLQSNLYLKENSQPAKISVYYNGAIYEGLENVAEALFTASKAGSYEIKYVSPVSDLITHSVTFEAAADEVAVVAEELSSVYLWNSTLEVLPADVYVNGSKLACSVELRYPSGKTVGTGTATLDELGDYEVVHSYTHEGAKQYIQKFRVEQTADSMFSKSDSKTEISYGAMSGNNEVSGVRLSLVENQPVVYEQIIDLSDNTKDDMLVELMAQPSTIGNNDITILYLTFTDLENEENTMSVRLAYTVYTQHATFVTAKGGESQWYTAWNEVYETVESATNHFVYGFISRHSFTQSPRANYPYLDATLKLQYDYEENALYSNPEVYGDPTLVCDFDDEKFFGANLWGGFTSGKVKMSIHGTGIASKGDIYVISVDGKTFNKETYTDNAAPNVTPKFVGADVPVAEVGVPYQVIDYTAQDAYSAVKNTFYEVYYNDTKVSVVDGAFTPTNTGVYTIVYKAIDSFGNEAKYSLHVNALESVTTPTLAVNDIIPSEVAFGQRVVLPSCVASGGAGGLTTDISVAINGEKVDLIANQFTAEEVGTYTVTYTVTDYLGRTESKKYFIDCTYALYPIIDEASISLPPAFIHGESYTFDDYEAIFYLSNESKSYISPKIEITDANGTHTLDGLTYTPVATVDKQTVVDDIEVKFIFEKEGAQTLTIAREIPVVYFKGENGENAKYLITENAEATADAKGIVYKAIENGSFKLTFARALSVRDLRFIFSAIDSNKQTVLKNYNSIKITLRDVRNAAQTICVEYARNGAGLSVTLNGRTTTTAFNKEGEFEFQYDEQTHTIKDISDITLGTVTHTVDGNIFSGFASGEIYASIEVCGVIGDCALNFKSIKNQVFNYIPSDRVDPVLWVNGSISGSYDIGAEILIPTAGAYDVLSAITPVTVTITAPDGSVLLDGATADKEYTLTMGQYGTYFIRYQVTDAKGRKKTVTMSAIVLDVAAPTLEFTKEIPQTVKVGTEISLNEYTVKDNKHSSGVLISISLFNPSGAYAEVKSDKVKLNDVGTYLLTYMAIDEDNNVTVYDFSIVVTK